MVNALPQLPARSQAPGELREKLVLLVFPREIRIGGRLTVGVAKVLVSGKEPQSFADDRATEAGREITILRALVAAVQMPRTIVLEPHRLAGQRVGLPVVGRIVLKAVPARLGDDVDDGALDIAVLDRGPHRLDLQLLDEVDAWVGPRHPIACRGDARAIEEILILIHAGAEGGNEDAAPRWRRRRDAGCGLDPVLVTESSHRDRIEVFGAEPGAEAGVPGVEARAGSVHVNRVRQGCQRQDRRSLDGGPCANVDVGVVMRAKSLQDDVERVRSRRHAREPQLPPLACLRRQLPANQRRRADSDDCAREHAALFVLDGADEGPGQALRDGEPWKQETSDDQPFSQHPMDARTPPAVRHVPSPPDWKAKTGRENLHGAGCARKYGSDRGAPRLPR
jgi:hypothetical protein